MKRFIRSMLGVTLLEIMLVLAVAAMIIVLSVRYYQSASANQQANSLLQQLEAITAIADGIGQANNSYSTVNTTNVQGQMPNQNMNTPWGSSISVTGSTNAYTVSISTGIPAAVCAQIVPRLETNAKYGTPTCSGGSLNYTYTAST